MSLPFNSVYKVIIIMAGVVVVLVSAILLSSSDDHLHLWFFDVGQGDSVLIKTPTQHYFLIDGGPSDRLVGQLGKAMPFWQRKIDAVFLTHPHSDHLIGLIEVLKRFEVKKVFINPIKNPTPEWEALFKVIVEKNIPVRHFWQSEEMTDKDLKLLGVWPKFSHQAIDESFDFNQISMVLSLQWQNFRVLLTGDSELGLDNPELEFYPWESVDILKVPHHGSDNALSGVSLGGLTPKIGVVSVGKGNEFKLPNQRLIDLLNQFGIKIWRTDDNGSLEVISDGKGWKIR